MKPRLVSSVLVLMRNVVPFLILVVSVAVGCASSPGAQLIEANSSFRGDDGDALRRLAPVGLKDPFAAMGRAALPPTRLKNPFVRLSPKLRHSRVRKRRRPDRTRRAPRARRVAELPELGLKDPFAN